MRLMKFWEWMNQKYIDWRGDSRKTISEFAQYVGVAQSVMSKWMNPNSPMPNAKNVAKIAQKLGLEAYDILSIPRPIASPYDGLPPELRSSFDAALTEINSIYAIRGLDAESEAAVTVAIEVMAKHGFIWRETRKSK